MWNFRGTGRVSRVPFGRGEGSRLLATKPFGLFRRSGRDRGPPPRSFCLIFIPGLVQIPAFVVRPSTETAADIIVARCETRGGLRREFRGHPQIQEEDNRENHRTWGRGRPAGAGGLEWPISRLGGTISRKRVRSGKANGRFPGLLDGYGGFPRGGFAAGRKGNGAISKKQSISPPRWRKHWESSVDHA